VYLVKTPEVIKPLASDLVWNFDRNKRDLYITFDDGPTPDITLEILDILRAFNASATFFCIGGNIKRWPGNFGAIVNEGHSIGNHTWNHMSGWEYSDYSYYRNVLECAQFVKSNLFRPPYGRITRSQVKGLKNRYKLIMWDVLSADWSEGTTPEKCYENVIRNSRSGSIIVFHDSDKAKRNMLHALPKALKHWTEEGYSFQSIM
jgi:peptidoglycan/xylan/chitin deacetylase (PgdA/CDA1 family)